MNIGPSESVFLTQVIDVAHLHGWKAHHVRTAWSKKGYITPIQGDAGFPDIVLVKAPRVLFVELKVDNGRLTPPQEWWLDDLEKCPGVEMYVWRPKMWDFLVAVLKREGVITNDRNNRGQTEIT